MEDRKVIRYKQTVPWNYICHAKFDAFVIDYTSSAYIQQFGKIKAIHSVILFGS